MTPDFAPEKARLAVVVDGDPGVRRLTVRALESAGFRCAAFRDGESALSWLSSSRAPRVITVDVDLPGMSGLQLVRALRARPRLERVPTVVLAEERALGDALAAGNLGALFVKKPFRTRDLVDAVLRLVAAAPPPRILIVDDDSDIREAIDCVVREQGYDAVCARDGLDALRVIDDPVAPPHLVILDVLMPRLDGIGLAQVLRAREATLPVVLVSAHEDVAKHAEVLGVAGHLRKPVTLDDLLDVIRTVTTAPVTRAI